MSRFLPNRFWMAFLLALGALALLPVALGPFQKTLLLETLIWSLFACSFNILYGYTGMLSFGQSMFFGFGGYGAAFLMDRGHVTPLLAIPAAILLSCGLAMVTGIFIHRLRGHAFSLVTLILSLTLYFLALNQSHFTGGDDGYPIQVPDVTLGHFRFPVRGFWCPYILVLSFTSMGFLVYRWLVASSAWSYIWRGIRDNEAQAELLAYEIPWCKFLAWTVSGSLAGLAGALYAVAFRYANASWFHWTLSGEAVVWTLIGGSGTLLGPLIGTFFLIIFKDAVSTWNEQLYPLFVGVLLILVTLAAPSGLMGFLRKAYDGISRRFPQPAPVPGPTQPRIDSRPRGVPSAAPASHQPGTEDRPGDRRKPPLLEVKNVAMQFGAITVLENISLTLHDAVDEWSPPRPTLIGPNGSGKSVLFDIILGKRTPTRGSVFLRNEHGGPSHDLRGLPTWKRAKLGLSAMTQEPSIFPRLTVFENLWLAVFSREPLRRRFAAAGTRREIPVRVGQFLDWLGLASLADREARELSHGMKRILQFGMILAREPILMLLDEPTSGLSIVAVEQFTDLLDSAGQLSAHRRTEFVVEHDLRWVKDNASHLIVLCDGSMIANTCEDGRSVSEALADKSVLRAFLGKLN